MGKTGLRSAGALALAGLFATSAIVSAQKPGKQKPKQVPETGVETVLTAPTEAVGEALLEQMTSRSSAGLVEVAQADGTVSMDLQGRFMSVMVAATAPDGSQSVVCETGPEALKNAVAGRSEASAAAQKSSRPVKAAPAARELK
jgi:hypothetical protein